MIRIEWNGPDDHYILASFRYYPQANQKISKLPGAQFINRGEKRFWQLPVTQYEALHALFPGEIVGPPVWKVLGHEPPPPPAWLTALTPRLHDPIPRMINPDKQLYDYQMVGANFATICITELGLGAIFDEMGLGKTPQGVAVIAKLRTDQERFRSGPALYVTKATLISQTVHEGFEDFSDLKVIGIEGTAKQRQKLWAQAHEYEAIVIGYETVLNDREYLEKLIIPLLIFDEAHKLKNRMGVMYKAYKSLIKQWSCALLMLTGTPIQNRAEEAYAIFALHPTGEKALGKPTEFAKHYLRTQFNGKFTDILGYKNLHILAELMSHYYIRRQRAEAGVQIPKIKDGEPLQAWVDPTAEQMVLFEEFWGQLAGLAMQIAEAPTEADRESLVKKQQGVYILLQAAANDPALLRRSQSARIRKLYGHYGDQLSPKREAFREKIPELVESGKVLVFSQFKQQIELLADDLDELGIGYVVYTGDESTAERDSAVQSLRHDPYTKVMLATNAASDGLNLQVCRSLIHFDTPWNPTVFDQRNGRIQRPNSPYSEVLIIQLLCRDSIDDKVLTSNRLKRELSAILMPA